MATINPPTLTKKSVDSQSGMAYTEENGVKSALRGDIHPGTRTRAMYANTPEQTQAQEVLRAGGHETEPVGHTKYLEYGENLLPEEKRGLVEDLASENNTELTPDVEPYINIGQALEGSTQAQLGGVKPMNDVQKAAHYLNSTSDFVSHHLTSGDESGYQWYDENIAHLENGAKYLAEHDPSLAAYKGTLDGHRMTLFKGIVGIFSPRNNPKKNLSVALQAMRYAAKLDPHDPFGNGLVELGKKVAEKLRTKQTQGFDLASAISPVTLARFGNLVKKFGEQGAAEWLLNEHDFSDFKSLKPSINQNDLPTHPKEGQNLNVGSYLFGNKVGAFIANLNGNFEHVTKDVWFTRTWGRVFGSLMTHTKKGLAVKDLPQANQRRIMDRAAKETAKSLGLNPAEFQAVLWYAEQKLWRVLGHHAKSYSFVDGINDEIAKAGLPALQTPTPSSQEAKERREASVAGAVSRRREEVRPFSRTGSPDRFAAGEAMNPSLPATRGAAMTKPLPISVGGIKMTHEDLQKNPDLIAHLNEINNNAETQALQAKQAAQAKPDDTQGERVKGEEQPNSRVPTYDLGESLRQRKQLGPVKQDIPYVHPVSEKEQFPVQGKNAAQTIPTVHPATDHFQDGDPAFVNWVANHPLMKPFNWIGKQLDKYVLSRSGKPIRYAADPQKLTQLYGPEFAQWVSERGLQPSFRKTDPGDFRWYQEVDPSLYEGAVDPFAKSRLPKDVFHHLSTNPNIGVDPALHRAYSLQHNTPQEAYGELYKAWSKAKQNQLPRPGVVSKPAARPGYSSKLSRASVIRYSSATFASPNTEEGLDFNSALHRLRSPHQQAYRRLADHIYKQLGIEGRSHDAVGDWSDGAENSLVHVFDKPGDPEKMKYAAAWLGLLANQKSVLHFQEGKGPDSLYEMDVPSKSLEQVRGELGNHGIAFRTVIPTKEGVKIMVYDQGRQLRDRVQEFSRSHNATVRESTGQGEFVGDNSDTPTRKQARSIYRGIIDRYESGSRGSGSGTGIRPGDEGTPPASTGPASPSPTRTSRTGRKVKYSTHADRIASLHQMLKEAGKTPKTLASGSIKPNEQEHAVRGVLADATEEVGDPQAEFHRWAYHNELPEKQFPSELGASAWRPGEEFGEEKKKSDLPNLRPLIIHVSDPEKFQQALDAQRINGTPLIKPLAPLPKEQFPNIPVHGRPIYWVGPNGEALHRATVSRYGSLAETPDGPAAHDEDLGTHWQVSYHGNNSPRTPEMLSMAYHQGYVGTRNPHPETEILRTYQELGQEDSDNLRRYGHSAPGVVDPEFPVPQEHPSTLRGFAFDFTQDAFGNQNAGQFINKLLSKKNQSHLTAATSASRTPIGFRPTPATEDRLVTGSPVAEVLFEHARQIYHDLLKIKPRADINDFKKIIQHVVDENVNPKQTPEGVIRDLKMKGLPFADQLHENFPHLNDVRQHITPQNVQKVKDELPSALMTLFGRNHEDYLKKYNALSFGEQQRARAAFANWASRIGLDPDITRIGVTGPLAVMDRIKELTSRRPKRFDRVHGGLADDRPDSEFDSEQLAAGIKIEMEHTSDPDIAKEIAKDHLLEDKEYYKKLARIEKVAKYARIKSPPGGLIVRGLFYQGGKWLPVSMLKQAASPPKAPIPVPATTRAGLISQSR